MDSSDKNAGANMSSGPTWCSICNVTLDASSANEHYESRTHLNRCLQKGIGISLVPTLGDKWSSWCSVCNQALESVAATEEHYESRAHLNKCLQRGVGIPLTYATSAPAVQPAVPRFTQAGAASPQAGATGGFPSGSSNFRPGFTNKLKPRTVFPQTSRPMAFGAKKFPVQPFIHGQTPSNPRMTVPYNSGAYGQDMRPSDNFNQHDSSWQNQSSMKNGWPYCETCDQNFQTVGALSQHCSSSAHMEMKMMKQNQYHSPPQVSADQPRFYQGSTSHIRAQSQNQGQYFGSQSTVQQDHYRGNASQNQGTRYTAKEWRPFNRTVHFLS